MKKTNFDKLVDIVEGIMDTRLLTKDHEFIEGGFSIDDDKWISYNPTTDCITFYNIGNEELVIGRNDAVVDMLYELFYQLFVDGEEFHEKETN